MRSPRREYLGTLLLGAVGAAVVLVAVRQDWARVLTVQPRPLPASTAVVRGQDLLPAAGALGLAALAGLAALLATRRLARRLTGGVLAAFGVAIIVALSMPVTDAQVRGAVTGAAGTASSVPGGSTVRRRHHPGWRGVRDQPVQPRHHGGVPVALGGAGRCGAHRRGRAAGRLARPELAGHVQPLRPARPAAAVAQHRPGCALGSPQPGHRPHRCWSGASGAARTRLL